ncbi:MAG: amidohydrolase family protein, partial [Clostridia bacterium]|nr:amidohydrolase family protein [Clostridia bacterium]
MEFIDAHAHIYERLTGFGPHGEARAIGGGMVEWATGRKERFLKPEHGEYGFSYDMLATLMEEGDIGHAVLLQGSNYGFQNSYTAEAVRKHPDKFTGAGSFDPYAKHADLIFDHLVNDLGLKILKFEMSDGYGLVGY